MPPTKNDGGSRGLTENHRPNAFQSVTTAAIVTRDGDSRPASARRRKSRIAHASVYAPCSRRTLWAFAYVCPWCGLGHFGRARAEDDITGLRRSRCGRLVVVRAARVYRGRADSGAAA